MIILFSSIRLTLSHRNKGYKEQMDEQNIKAVETLKMLDYPLPNIRRAMHKLTGISKPDMAGTLEVSRQTITLTISGVRTNPEIQQQIAEIWQVPVEQLFEDAHGQKK